jgi:type I restriction-modification system DNA methylase subunit
VSNINLSSFIWSVADLLRGDYKQSDSGKVILPFTVLRRLDCVLEATKAAVLAEKAKREKAGVNSEPFLLKKTGTFYNDSPLDLKNPWATRTTSARTCARTSKVSRRRWCRRSQMSYGRSQDENGS